MEYVVDASVVVKWFIEEPYCQNAEALLVDFRNNRLNLAAPDHIVAEVASTLWKRSTLRKEISVSEANGSLADFLQIGIQLHPAPALMKAALRLAGQVRHTVYDMLYVALAVQLQCEFITADGKMVNKVRATFPFVRWLGDISPRTQL